MNKNLLNAMTKDNNYTLTENGGVTYKSTLNMVYDMFALGGAYRNRSDDDCILLFKKAIEEDRELALKCLFYLRDIRGGQGERRFFRVCLNWLANNYPKIVEKNLANIAEFGRWDDLYSLVDTPVETKMFNFMYKQACLDIDSKTPSLLGKWLKSENTSSKNSRILGRKTAEAFGLTSKQYRKVLVYLRKKINVLETLMSANEWDKIEFDKIPSKAGLKYKNAFAARDVIKKKYETFIKDKNTKVNASTLYPADIVEKVINNRYGNMSEIERLTLNKYWDNLEDYFNNSVFNGVAVVDTSASMISKPMAVAISLGLYCAEKCGKDSPFYNHYITFSRTARLIETEGVDFVDKVKRIVKQNLCENTNINSVFDLILKTALKNGLKNEDLPENIIIISDMEFDECAVSTATYNFNHFEPQTEMEKIKQNFELYGYKMPKLIFWNVDARTNNIPMKDENGITFVSGYSPIVFDMIMKGKSGKDLMLEKLNSKRYSVIKA